MKREFNFYKSWYAGFRFKDLIPCFGFSKNVQGWTFTRNCTLNWFTYCLQFSIMKTELSKIAQDLEQGRINENEAQDLLLGLLGVRKSVFVVCEEDEYGRDLWLCCKNSVEEAKEVKNIYPTLKIYEHWILL